MTKQAKGEKLVVLENLVVIGFDGALRGMRNPKDSWKRSDSYYDDEHNFIIGENDKNLMLRLAKLFLIIHKI